MRTKRSIRVKSKRKKKAREVFGYMFVIPVLSVIIGYLITSLIILPIALK